MQTARKLRARRFRHESGMVEIHECGPVEREREREREARVVVTRRRCDVA